jgi:hypothetical protein
MPKQDCQDRAVRTASTWDRQNGTGKMQNGTGRKDRLNRTGRTGRTEFLATNYVLACLRDWRSSQNMIFLLFVTLARLTRMAMRFSRKAILARQSWAIEAMKR